VLELFYQISFFEFSVQLIIVSLYTICIFANTQHVSHVSHCKVVSSHDFFMSQESQFLLLTRPFCAQERWEAAVVHRLLPSQPANRVGPVSNASGSRLYC